jgi:hypothetical protein
MRHWRLPARVVPKCAGVPSTTAAGAAFFACIRQRIFYEAPALCVRSTESLGKLSIEFQFRQQSALRLKLLAVCSPGYFFFGQTAG